MENDSKTHSQPIWCILAGCGIKYMLESSNQKRNIWKSHIYWSRELFWGTIIPKDPKCNLNPNSPNISKLLRWKYSSLDHESPAWCLSPAHVEWNHLLCICSLSVELKFNLDQYVNKRYPGLVKIVRNSKREGLIRARIHGWNAATAPVVGFFDAHVEFNTGW